MEEAFRRVEQRVFSATLLIKKRANRSEKSSVRG
jgi:hypothetical protein